MDFGDFPISAVTTDDFNYLYNEVLCGSTV